MKTTLYSLIAAATACGLAQGAATAYTTPVGYTTQTLPASKTTLVGFNVLTPTLAAGTFTNVVGATLTDTKVDFSAVLPAGKTCVLEITSGTTVPLVIGTVQEFTTWGAPSVNDITLPAAITGLAIGDSYRVRVAPTVQETFAPPVIAGAATVGGADKVWVPNGSGGFTKYWYRITIAPTGWRTTTTGLNDTGAVAAPVPLTYVDGVLVEKKLVASSLVLSGEVKKTGSNNLAAVGLNPFSVVPPVGLTLNTSGLGGNTTNSIAGAATVGGADKVWVPDGLGNYTKIWWRITISPTGWRTTTTGLNDTGALVGDPILPAGVLIDRKTSPRVIKMNVPANYSDL